MINASGLHVYPGFIDSATEIGLSEIEAVRESTDVRGLGNFNPQLTSWQATNSSSEHTPVTRANGIASVIALPQGDLVAGRASLIHLSGWTKKEMTVSPTVALFVNWPVIRRIPFTSRRDLQPSRTSK